MATMGFVAANWTSIRTSASKLRKVDMIAVVALLFCNQVQMFMSGVRKQVARSDICDICQNVDQGNPLPS
jgi:hypothetical protein